MKRLFVFLCALLIGCAAIPAAVLMDGDLAVTALTTLQNDLKLLGAPAAETNAVAVATTAVQTGVTDLKKGAKTAEDFAALVNDQISVVAPPLLTDFKANNTITTGVVLLQQLVLVIAAEATTNQSAVAPPPTARSVDVRAALKDWVMRHHK